MGPGDQVTPKVRLWGLENQKPHDVNFVGSYIIFVTTTSGACEGLKKLKKWGVDQNFVCVQNFMKIQMCLYSSSISLQHINPTFSGARVQLWGVAGGNALS